jgi:hypothetical protein
MFARTSHSLLRGAPADRIMIWESEPLESRMPDTVPPVAYHYTSIETLLKIVDSKVIRATSIRYLNDLSERAFALSAIRSRLKHHPMETQNLFAPAFERDDEERSFDELPFVASFSGLRDSLPQWRSYCPNGSGVSIGFSTESLNGWFIEFEGSSHRMKFLDRSLSHASIVFEPVKYLNREDNEALGSVIDGVVEEAKRDQKHYNESAPDYTDDEGRRMFDFVDLEQCVSGSLDGIASRTKHHSFRAENEFRLLVRLSFALEKIEYRCAKSTLVPFVSVSLPNPNEFATPRKKRKFAADLEKPFFIDSVTIGPTPNPELSKQALHTFFLGRGYDVTIHESEVPFRDWL